MQVNDRRIVVLGTGGTIAGRAASAQDNLGYRAGEIGVADLLQGVHVPAGVTVQAEQVANIDSKDMGFDTWCALSRRCSEWLAQADVAGIVVTHGTDTMEETAYFLHAVLAPVKPVVLTGAMRPATSALADGPQNLADAIAVAASPLVQGVSVVFAGAVHSAVDVQKVHAWRLDAFGSGDAGPLAYVEEGRLRVLRPWPQPLGVRSAASLPDPADWPRVEIVWSHAGADGRIVQALVRDRVAGLVVAATGNGTLHHALQDALLQAQSQGVAVRRATRCPQGRVMATPHDAIAGVDGLGPVKARVALMLELMA
ncbi:MAG TPA: asparaginase [Ramlibacter sp.]|jgi:L-asparaginase|nr:asparaginase [Ramlibacter sp.]